MKHLKKLTKSLSWGFDIELKDDYPDIYGEFHQNENINGGTLKLFCKPDIDTSIIGEHDYTLAKD